jgi:signal transduction histidine kinase
MNNACYAVKKKAETASSDYQPEVTVSVSVEGDQLIISLADNGEGMTEEVKQRLFENFFTTKPIGQGTGLGMAITRDIVENKHGGKLSFESTEGQGTTFTLTIPTKK